MFTIYDMRLSQTFFLARANNFTDIEFLRKISRNFFQIFPFFDCLIEKK
jgi:hypothetical protein